jgi:RNA polymerase sigma-B factor
VGALTAPAQDRVNTLARRWQRDGDESARAELVEQFLPLARNLARRYGRSSEPMDDLVQVASLGLVKAVDRFDTERGGSFQSYAIPTILGELRRYFRDSGWGVHVPRGAQERALSLRQARDLLTNQTGHAPTANQLAEYMEISIEQVLDGLQALNAYETSSLDAPAGDEDSAGTRGEAIGSEDVNYAQVDDATTVGSLMEELPSRDREILRLRFNEELTQAEIADRVGVSQMQVSRLLRRSIDRMRASLDEDVSVRRSPQPLLS